MHIVSNHSGIWSGTKQLVPPALWANEDNWPSLYTDEWVNYIISRYSIFALYAVAKPNIHIKDADAAVYK